MAKPKLDILKDLILDMVEVEKDMGLEVDVRYGLINFKKILDHETNGKLELIAALMDQVDEYPIEAQPHLLSLLHEAHYDILHGKL